MNLELKMKFDTVEELMQFVTGRNTQPSTAGAAVEKAPLRAVPAETVADHIEDFLVADDEPEVDLVALRAKVHASLTVKAKAMGAEASVLGAFITGFGVKKFSELPDDMLVPFEEAFIAEFGE